LRELVVVVHTPPVRMCMVIRYSKRLFAHPQRQTSALQQRSDMRSPVAQAILGFGNLPSHTSRLTSPSSAQLLVQQSRLVR
jgi:hypothetical protein